MPIAAIIQLITAAIPLLEMLVTLIEQLVAHAQPTPVPVPAQIAALQARTMADMIDLWATQAGDADEAGQIILRTARELTVRARATATVTLETT